ncbi:hypothetical protein [Paenibacillus ginsengarvi]|uniref:hypothetical protein n=1 Tax=Paenibacillus ginsengarvi TaxID=400777 RepID=UPI0013157A71|nr:hypothetical protein [Paenibacillus ginsengarvi]
MLERIMGLLNGKQGKGFGFGGGMGSFGGKRRKGIGPERMISSILNNVMKKRR